MSRPIAVMLVVFAAITPMGCQTMGRPATETTVDKELIAHPSPSTPTAEEMEEEPRSGFHQESQKSQQP